MQETEIRLYHPKLLKILTHEQLELLADHSICNVDKDNLIHVLYSNMDFGHCEIYCDCEAQMLNHAIIYVQFNTTLEDAHLNANEFWELYIKSKPKECVSIRIDF